MIAKSSDAEDWYKFRQLSGHLWATRFLPLVMSIDGEGEAQVCACGSHAVHDDGKGQSGMHLVMGTRAMINVSKKLGLATTSSMETGIISTGERFPKYSWFRDLRLAQ